MPLQEKQLFEKVLRMLSGEHSLLRHLQVRWLGATHSVLFERYTSFVFCVLFSKVL